MHYLDVKGRAMHEPHSGELLAKLGPGSYRAGLVEQITRDMQTLGQLRTLGYVAHPGEQFYLDRIEAYQRTLSEIDLQISDRGSSKGDADAI
jgi:hypothetical protein